MIDELDLFHGSNDDFSEFDAAYIKTSIYGCGFNFTTDIELASDYGNKIYTIEIPDSSKLFLLNKTTIKLPSSISFLVPIYPIFAKISLITILPSALRTEDNSVDISQNTV